MFILSKTLICFARQVILCLIIILHKNEDGPREPAVQKFRRYSRNRHSLTIQVLTVTLTLKKAKLGGGDSGSEETGCMGQGCNGELVKTAGVVNK